MGIYTDQLEMFAVYLRLAASHDASATGRAGSVWPIEDDQMIWSRKIG